jgi:hypothetical protein
MLHAQERIVVHHVLPETKKEIILCICTFDFRSNCMRNSIKQKLTSTYLTFVGPRSIVIYFYSKTIQMHNISILFYFETTFYKFRTVFPSIIRSLRLYIQHQVYVIQVLWLLASKQHAKRCSKIK